jgi:hypothetical protein
MFLGLCSYLLAQAYLVPLVAIGPWALWPRLADLATGALVGAFLLEYRAIMPPSPANRRIIIGFGIFFGLGIFSYAWYLAFLNRPGDPGMNVGAFQIVTMLKFFSIFWIAARIPLTPQRLAILRKLSIGVFLAVIVSIVLSYLNIVPVNMFAPQLPIGEDAAGPWHKYTAPTYTEPRGWGTVGYNHAYTAAHVLLLLALCLHLGSPRTALPDSTLVLLGVMGCFLSGSRAGLAAMLFFAAVYWLKKPIHGVAALLVSGLIAGAVFAMYSDTLTALETELTHIVQRQSVLTDAPDRDDLVGRAEIWEARIAFLDEDQVRWIVGSGFGAALDSGSDAHMLPLHIIVEMGVLSLAVFVCLFGMILTALYQHGRHQKVLFWATVAFLLGSATQETFYPVAALGHFMGLYFCVVAIGLRAPVASIQEQPYRVPSSAHSSYAVPLNMKLPIR